MIIHSDDVTVHVHVHNDNYLNNEGVSSTSTSTSMHACIYELFGGACGGAYTCACPFSRNFTTITSVTMHTHTHTLCHCSLEEDRDQVEREHSRLPKKEELEQLIKQLTRDTEQLKDEIQLVS